MRPTGPPAARVHLDGRAVRGSSAAFVALRVRSIAPAAWWAMSDSMYADAAAISAGGEGFSTGLIAPESGGRAASMSACDFGSDVKAAIALVTGSKLNLLLVFCPLGMAAESMGLGASMVFFLNFLVRSTSYTPIDATEPDNCVF